MKPGKIFIHHDGALGDTLLSLPCIHVVTEYASHIHITGRMDVVQFLKEAGIADEVSSADSRFYSSLYAGSIDEPMITFLSGFDLSFVFTANIESQLLKNIRTVIPDTRAILTIPPEASPEHAAQFRLNQCGYGADAAHRKPTLRIPDKEMRWAAEFLRVQGFAAGQRLITIHPGSGGKRKCWPLENYAALVRYFLQDPRIFCVIAAGPAEDAAALASHLLSGGRVISLHDESLMRVASLLSHSEFYVGNDSGISHLAGILGCPGAVLFGPTDPFVWRPQGNTIGVVRFTGMGAEVVSEIISLFERRDIRS